MWIRDLSDTSILYPKKMFFIYIYCWHHLYRIDIKALRLTLSSQMKKRDRFIVFSQILFNEVTVCSFSAQQLLVECLLCAGHHTTHREYRNELISPPWSSQSSQRQTHLMEHGEGCSAWEWGGQRGQSISWKRRGGWVQALTSHLDSYQSLPQHCQSIFLEFINPVISLPCLNAPAVPHWLPPQTVAPFQPLPCPPLPPLLYSLLAQVQILPLRLVSSLPLSFLKLGECQ